MDKETVVALALGVIPALAAILLLIGSTPFARPANNQPVPTPLSLVARVTRFLHIAVLRWHYQQLDDECRWLLSAYAECHESRKAKWRDELVSTVRRRTEIHDKIRRLEDAQ